MMQKLLTALLEGNLFQKMFCALKKHVKHILISIDYMVSYFPQKYCRSHLKIVPNRIVIMTNTFNYTCNPKYIYEALCKSGFDLDIYWIIRKNKNVENFPPSTKLLQLGTWQCLKAVYSAKIWLDNGIVFSNYYDKKEAQIHIQTMHGSLGIKRLDNAVIARNARGGSGKRVVKREEENTNLVITNSKFEEDVFKTVFWHDTPMLRLGHARTDILFLTQCSEVIKRVRENLWRKYKIPKDCKIVLYAPTHRLNLTIDDLDIDYQLLCEELEKKFGGQFVVLFRLHPRMLRIMKNLVEEPHIFNVTDYPDIQELMLVTDIAITDYSSWIYDYLNTRKPGFIYATDIDRYNNRTGFYYPLEETPFPICEDNDDLVLAIRNFDNDIYQKKVEKFLREKDAVDDGHSAERIALKIIELIGNDIQRG